MTTIAITGAGGRMGQRLIALAAEHDLRVVAATERAGHAALGRDAGELCGIGALGVKVSEDLGQAAPQVVIDFTAPAGRHR